ncbi:MAG TPA: hypothetical protein VNI84_06415 [Pyrinomonadaceae bacterium]|nr:hypothetical protein [Pyrinomonadaceae bacterium]
MFSEFFRQNRLRRVITTHSVNASAGRYRMRMREQRGQLNKL